MTAFDDALAALRAEAVCLLFDQLPPAIEYVSVEVDSGDLTLCQYTDAAGNYLYPDVDPAVVVGPLIEVSGPLLHAVHLLAEPHAELPDRVRDVHFLMASYRMGLTYVLRRPAPRT